MKPQNLLLSGNTLKIADFGLVRCLENSDTWHTGSHTPMYAAPEFFKNQVSSRSDQYCLAITYCELRGGCPPFCGSIYNITNGHLRGEPNLSMLPFSERPIVRRRWPRIPNTDGHHVPRLWQRYGTARTRSPCGKSCSPIRKRHPVQADPGDPPARDARSRSGRKSRDRRRGRRRLGARPSSD